MTEEAIMTDEQLQRIHEIEYSCDSREELAERIVGLEDELAKWERLTAGIELPEYPITQFQPKDLERENAKLRELCIDFASMLTYAGLDGLRVEATIGGVTKTYDASELCDMAENLCDEVS